MPEAVTWFEPQPPPAELPERFADPFVPGMPHPLALRAAEELRRRLRGGDLPDGLRLEALEEPGHGMMFGVLVVSAPDGRVGYLCGFSGMLAGRWHIEGFVPPLFDAVARDAVWPAGEAELRAFEERHRELTRGAEVLALRARLAELNARHEAASAALRARHDANRAGRHDARGRLHGATVAADERRTGLDALARESRVDDTERRRLEAEHLRQREALTAQLRALDARRVELERVRAERSNQLLQQLLDTYVLPNARGEQRSLCSLFAPELPPGGAGDCAAPKLLGHAYRHHLRPLALAEFWWGATSASGSYHAGTYYPACHSKCGGVLPYMLQGLPMDGVPRSLAAGTATEELRVVFEDPWLLVVDKPCGLLPVPGRHEPLRDSVLVRLRRRDPGAAELRLVHRPEAETSGLLLVAKDAETCAALQRQFALREACSRHVAWVDGEVEGERGLIELPLQGKPALTEWHVLLRTGTRTRLALHPRTHQPHQLRVHAAEPLGLGAPIVGDRLHGRDGERLLLHAEALSFTHPRTGQRVELDSPAPF